MYHYQPVTQRVFVQAPYRPDERGDLECRLPHDCPRAEAGSPCRVGVHHFRDRTTGPCFPLVVAVCATHGPPAFTVYPPGHVPYGRVVVAPARTDGKGLLRDADIGTPAWGQTLLEAAQTAASGERWDRLGGKRDGTSNSPAHNRTMRRHLDLAGKLFGVHPDLPSRAREAVAERLDVPVLVLQDAKARWVASRSWTMHAQEILEAVAAIPVTRSMPEKVIEAGAEVGLWPAPVFWRPDRRLLERSRPSVRPDSHAPMGPDPPSTTSRLLNSLKRGSKGV